MEDRQLGVGDLKNKSNREKDMQLTSRNWSNITHVMQLPRSTYTMKEWNQDSQRMQSSIVGGDVQVHDL